LTKLAAVEVGYGEEIFLKFRKWGKLQKEVTGVSENDQPSNGLLTDADAFAGDWRQNEGYYGDD